MTASMQHQMRVGVGATSGAAATLELEFLQCGLGFDESIISSDGMRGDRSRTIEEAVEGTGAPDGPLVIEPRPGDLDFFIPKFMGAGSNPNYTLAQTIPSWGLDVYKVAQSARYLGTKIDVATLRSSTNQKLQLAMALCALDEELGISFPNIANTVSLLQPYVHHELTFEINSVEYEPAEIEIVVNNVLVKDRFLNSAVRTELPEGDRLVTLSCLLPFTTLEAGNLYNLTLPGVPASAVWTKGNYSLTAEFVRIFAARKPVQVMSRQQELMYRMEFICRKDLTTDTNELLMTNDSTG